MWFNINVMRCVMTINILLKFYSAIENMPLTFSWNYYIDDALPIDIALRIGRIGSKFDIFL